MTKECLGNFITTQKGFAFKSNDYISSGVGIVRVSDFTEDSVDDSNLVYIDCQLANNYKQYQLNVNDVIVQTVGSWPTNPQSVVGKVIKIPSKINGFLLNQNAVKLIPNKEIDLKYLYYLLKSKNFASYIVACARGAASQASITLEDIKGYEFTKPIMESQLKIAKVLSNYDDLIENNNNRIKILEEMAQKIYKEWFVDFKFQGHETATFKQTELGKIPSDWEFIKLQKILSLQHGYAFKSSQFSDNKTNKILVRMGNFQSYGGVQFEDNTKYLIDGEQYQEKYVLNAKDLVMVLSDVTREGRIIGNVGFIPDDNNTYLLNQRVARINTDEKYKQFLMLLFNSKIFKNHCLSRADSATVLNLSNDDIYDYKISLPNDSILSKFNQIISPILKKISIVISKNQILKQTRDLLLPRLISGEIDVENMKIA